VRLKGVVAWFSNAKGYGFISSEGRPDLFVHYSAIQGDGYKSLREGATVEFEMSKDPSGKNQAGAVTLSSITSSEQSRTVIRLIPPTRDSQNDQLDLEEFFVNLVRAISLKPSTVTLDKPSAKGSRHLSLCVDEDDFELCARADGKVFRAIQTTLGALLHREKMFATLQITARQSGLHLN
jgi:CspA family cold shock protein